jgi:hypothetical protein
MFLFGSTALPSHPITKVTQIAIACVLSRISVRIDEHQNETLQPHADIAHGASIKQYNAWLDYSMSPPKRELKMADAVLEPVFNPSHPVLKALYAHKIEAAVVAELKSPSFVRTLIQPSNATAKKLLGMGQELQYLLSLKAAPIISITNGTIAIDTPRSDRQIAKFADYWKPSSKFEAAIGVNIDNKLVSIDLSDPETCHILFAGMTGSGKSVWLQSLLLSLLIGRSTEEILVIICDPKWVSFQAFDNCANRLIPTINTVDELLIVGDWLVAEMNRRYMLFADHRVENLDQYNAIVSVCSRLPRILLLIDEYGDLKQSCGKDKIGVAKWNRVLSINIQLGQKARAAGMPECIGSQKAVDVIDKQIRVNLPARVLLKVLEEGDTECVLGKVPFDGRDLLGRGDLFFNGDRLQSLLCESSDFAKLTKGAPLYQLEDLAQSQYDLKMAVAKNDAIACFHDLTADDWKQINSSDDDLMRYPHLKKIVTFLEKKDWTIDNRIKQGISIFKNEQTPIAEIHGYLQLLEVKGYLETRNAGRNALEARIL